MSTIRVVEVDRNRKTVTMTNGQATVTFSGTRKMTEIGFFSPAEYKQVIKILHGINKEI